MTAQTAEQSERADAPMTLKEAGELYHLTVSTLRTEASRGRLDIFRLGKRDYTTLQSMREMVRRCQDAARHRASTSTKSVDSGLSETDRASSAQAALNQTVIALRNNSRATSGRNTNRRAGQTR